jgi:para-aminobenzoate synthetase/4-amino-4-deoxychorismate lyase
MNSFLSDPIDRQSGLSANRSGWTHGRVVLQDGRRSLLFEDPLQVISIQNPDEVDSALRYVTAHIDDHGLYAAGFLTYEAAAAYHLAVKQPLAGSLPLLWFGLYDRPKEVEIMAVPYGTYQVGEWESALDWPAYRRVIAAIKSYIAEGHTYQVNYTMPLSATFRGDPWALYRDLAQSQQAQFMAYLDLGQFVICSASPELFFMREGEQLFSRPMKGTAHRGRTLAEDRLQMEWLRNSEKNRAENVMIVDMIRNDFGRIAEIGSVEVPELFTVERYPTLLQMTSTVSARSKASLPAIMRAMFPCASITGAPKVRTMEIIKELEPQARGIYTGSIGYIAPGNKATFNVAIRTVVIDRHNEKATYGVGGGIVWDSEAGLEYEEAFLKAQVLIRRQPIFELLETMRWSDDEGYFLRDMHLQRLAQSAEYFDFQLNLATVEKLLADLALTLSGLSRVRLLVNKEGEITLESFPLEPVSQNRRLQVALAVKPISAENVWLYHKTTNRQVYDEARASRPEVDEVILWNKEGEVTEGTISNIVVDLDGVLFTPPVTCGLLNGTFRQYLLRNEKILERTISIEDLHHNRKVYLINSVRLWQEAEIIDVQQIKLGEK